MEQSSVIHDILTISLEILDENDFVEYDDFVEDNVSTPVLKLTPVLKPASVLEKSSIRISSEPILENSSIHIGGGKNKIYNISKTQKIPKSLSNYKRCNCIFMEKNLIGENLDDESIRVKLLNYVYNEEIDKFNNSINIQHPINIKQKIYPKNIETQSGGKYRKKYFKYKTKYLKLKNILN